MKVDLRRRIVQDIGDALNFDKRAFKQEEGGYLVGRFDGQVLEIVRHFHDPEAERTGVSIRLREAHLDFVTEYVAQQADPTLYVSGTWHVHPPGCDANYSAVDAECLFLEHATLRAGSLATAKIPRAHLIIPWAAPERQQVHTMRVMIPGISLQRIQPQRSIVAGIEHWLARNPRPGILLERDRISVRGYEGSEIASATAKGILRGFFWPFPYPSISLDVEFIFLGNFLNHVRRGWKGRKRRTAIKLDYYRLTLEDGQPRVEPFRVSLEVPGREAWAAYGPADWSESIAVLLSNPDVPEEAATDMGASKETTVGEIGRSLQLRLHLKQAPIISALCPSTEAEKWKQRAVVDDGGEVMLPDDVAVRELLSGENDGSIAMLWRSSELHGDIVYRLRTQRLADLEGSLERRKESGITIGGLGLLGSEIVTLLVAAGVGRLYVVDDGVVDFTNAHRQRLYTVGDVYRRKVDVAIGRVAGSGIVAEGHHLTVPTVGGDQDGFEESLARLNELIRKSELVVGALDCFSGRAVLQALCTANGVPFLSAALDVVEPSRKAQGNIVLSLPGKPGCYACRRKLGSKGDHGSCTVAPLGFPPVAGALAAELAKDYLDGRIVMPCEIEVLADMAIERHDIGVADRDCEICGEGGVGRGDPAGLFQRIRAWLGETRAT